MNTKKILVITSILAVILLSAYSVAIYGSTNTLNNTHHRHPRVIRFAGVVEEVTEYGLIVHTHNRSVEVNCSGSWIYTNVTSRNPRQLRNNAHRGEWPDISSYFAEGDRVRIAAIRRGDTLIAVGIVNINEHLVMFRPRLLRLIRGSGAIGVVTGGRVVFINNRVMIIAQRRGYVIVRVAGPWMNTADNTTGPITNFVHRGDTVRVAGLLYIREFRGRHFYVMIPHRIIDLTSDITLVRPQSSHSSS